jgi:hypothetical protein
MWDTETCPHTYDAAYIAMKKAPVAIDSLGSESLLLRGLIC